MISNPQLSKVLSNPKLDDTLKFFHPEGEHIRILMIICRFNGNGADVWRNLFKGHSKHTETWIHHNSIINELEHRELVYLERATNNIVEHYHFHKELPTKLRGLRKQQINYNVGHIQLTGTKPGRLPDKPDTIHFRGSFFKNLPGLGLSPDKLYTLELWLTVDGQLTLTIDETTDSFAQSTNSQP